MTFLTGERSARPETWWTRWVRRPEQLWLRQFLFQLHFWLGAAVGVWVLLLSVTGAVLVFRDQLSAVVPMDWLLALHARLLAGARGRELNAAAALSLAVLALTGAAIWWPGRTYWRRSLKIEWRARFPRMSWDAHSALGFWFLPFVAMWGVSGVYLAAPQWFDLLYRLDPADRVVDRALFALTALHFGRFGLVTQVIWAIVGLVPAVLAFTGIFICCRRVIFKKPSNPRTAAS
jgi:uncharacterized iron-regulated membrane protein